MKLIKVLTLVPSLILIGCKGQPLMSQNNKNFEDPYLWLEEVESEKALSFSKEANQKTLAHFKANPLFGTLEKDVREITLAQDRIPDVTLINGELYNFWQDDKHIRGIWRKTSVQSYKTAHPKWEILLDLDALSKKENENWVWKGADALPPHYQRTLIHLSRGGKDASVIREFDVKTKKFIADGFNVSVAKNFITWKDKDTVYIATDFGADSMTKAGYPRIIKKWKRGVPLSEAKSVHQVDKTDIFARTFVQFTDHETYVFHIRQISFYENEIWYENTAGEKILVPMPKDIDFQGVFKKQMLFVLKSNLRNFKQGSLVSLPLDKIDEGKKAQEHLQLVMESTDKKFVQWISMTKNFLFINTIDNILSKIVKVDFKQPSEWIFKDVSLGESGNALIKSTDEVSDLYLAQYTDFLTPTSVFVGNAGSTNNNLQLLKMSPHRFNSKDMLVDRFEATSRDGTKIPYFVVSKKGTALTGTNPTLLYGYGGFEISMQPFYLGPIGKTWVERGGIYVLSNLRGGGEFGPAWHQSVIKENRYKVYEDNIAIAEDLVQRKITSPAHLGISGGSNGGLLTGATFTLRPDLFKAVIVEVPLLDMLRYHKLLAGASWMAEYGDPEDPKMRDAILKYSPYQKVQPDVRYPEVFFMTSTKDDRVHPGHARKMYAKMKDQGHPVFYYENMEGGHSGSANLEQKILWNTLEYVYLWEKLK